MPLLFAAGFNEAILTFYSFSTLLMRNNHHTPSKAGNPFGMVNVPLLIFYSGFLQFSVTHEKSSRYYVTII